MNPAISSFVPPVAPQAPVPSAPPASSSQSGFSQMLNQAQARDAEAAAPEAAPETAPKPAHAGDRGKAEKAGKGDKGSKAEGEPRAERAEDDTATADSAAAEATHDAPATDPALADWLATLQRPTAPPDEAAAKAALGQGETDAAPSGKGGAARGALGAAARDLKAQDSADAARELQAKGQPATRELAEAPSSFKAALAQVDESRRDAQPAQELPSAPTAAAAGLASAPGATRAGEAAAPVSVQVPTPATSPEFAHKLGVQVSVLAKDGIQQAELHLNPAEMGPISIQIAIEGTQAQVNFGADSAATRQIIENGLPELAASLREAGFTLSGGGVHSQAQKREQGGDGDGEGPRARAASRGIGGSNETDVTPRPVLSRVSAGGVDLYA